MLVKYWKSFKWFLFIPLIIFVFVFKISSVSALVYKNAEWYANISDSVYTGNFDNAVQLDIPLGFNKENYDYIGIKLQRFLFSSTPITYNYTDNSMTCSQWNLYNNGYICASYNPTTQVDHQQPDSNVSITAVILNSTGQGNQCFIDNSISDFLICPLNNINDLDHIYFHIATFNVSPQVYVNYKLQFSKTVVYFNNDSTEMTTQQNITNTNLQYIYTQQQQQQTYMENSTTTGATTQVQGDFSDLASSFNSELQGVNDLSQLVLMPISLFMDLSTDNCQPLHLVVPFVNTSVDLPCMKAIFNTYFSGFYSIFTTIMSAVICYWVAIKTGALVKEIVDCDNDRIEVVDL